MEAKSVNQFEMMVFGILGKASDVWSCFLDIYYYSESEGASELRDQRRGRKTEAAEEAVAYNSVYYGAMHR